MNAEYNSTLLAGPVKTDILNKRKKARRQLKSTSYRTMPFHSFLFKLCQQFRNWSGLFFPIRNIVQISLHWTSISLDSWRSFLEGQSSPVMTNSSNLKVDASEAKNTFFMQNMEATGLMVPVHCKEKWLLGKVMWSKSVCSFCFLCNFAIILYIWTLPVHNMYGILYTCLMINVITNRKQVCLTNSTVYIFKYCTHF